MKMYSERSVVYIVQDYLAHHFGFEYVTLSLESIDKIEQICENYGIEVENIASQ